MTDQSLIFSGDSETIQLSQISGEHVLTQQVPETGRPFIHPITAPDGVGVLTQDRPDHHPWQRGLYTGFNLVNGIGFWRDEPGDGTFEATLSGEPVAEGSVARWVVHNKWRHPDGTQLLFEEQSWTLQRDEAAYIIDLDWSLTASTSVEIGQFMAGGLFLRMPFDPEVGAAALNSEGLCDLEAEKQRARWAAVAMPVAGRTNPVGFAILDHPDNPNHPTTWRVDNEYGLSPSRVIAETWSIQKDDVDRYAFRLFVFCGQIDRDRIENVWRQFAANK